MNPADNTPTRLKFGAFLKQYLKQSLQVFKHPKQLLPTIILTVVWMVLGILQVRLKENLPMQVLNFITYAQGGLYGGVVGAIGGILGKVVVAAFVNALLVPLFQGKMPFKGAGSGFKDLLKSISLQSRSAVAPLLKGFGAALLLYGLSNINGSAENSMAGIMAAVSLVLAMGKKSGTLWNFAFSYANSVSKGKAPSYQGVLRALTGMTLGFALGVGLNAAGIGLVGLIGIIALVLGWILGMGTKKEAVVSALLVVLTLIPAPEAKAEQEPGEWVLVSQRTPPPPNSKIEIYCQTDGRSRGMLMDQLTNIKGDMESYSVTVKSRISRYQNGMGDHYETHTFSAKMSPMPKTIKPGDVYPLKFSVNDTNWEHYNGSFTVEAIYAAENAEDSAGGFFNADYVNLIDTEYPYKAEITFVPHERIESNRMMVVLYLEYTGGNYWDDEQIPASVLYTQYVYEWISHATPKKEVEQQSKETEETEFGQWYFDKEKVSFSNKKDFSGTSQNFKLTVDGAQGYGGIIPPAEPCLPGELYDLSLYFRWENEKANALAPPGGAQIGFSAQTDYKLLVGDQQQGTWTQTLPKEWKAHGAEESASRYQVRFPTKAEAGNRFSITVSYPLYDGESVQVEYIYKWVETKRVKEVTPEGADAGDDPEGTEDVEGEEDLSDLLSWLEDLLDNGEHTDEEETILIDLIAALTAAGAAGAAGGGLPFGPDGGEPDGGEDGKSEEEKEWEKKQKEYDDWVNRMKDRYTRKNPDGTVTVIDPATGERSTLYPTEEGNYKNEDGNPVTDNDLANWLDDHERNSGYYNDIASTAKNYQDANRKAEEEERERVRKGEKSQMQKDIENARNKREVEQKQDYFNRLADKYGIDKNAKDLKKEIKKAILRDRQDAINERNKAGEDEAFYDTAIKTTNRVQTGCDLIFTAIGAFGGPVGKAGKAYYTLAKATLGRGANAASKGGKFSEGMLGGMIEGSIEAGQGYIENGYINTAVAAVKQSYSSWLDGDKPSDAAKKVLTAALLQAASNGTGKLVDKSAKWFNNNISTLRVGRAEMDLCMYTEDIDSWVKGTLNVAEQAKGTADVLWDVIGKSLEDDE